MEKEKAKQLVEWLYAELEQVSKEMKEARKRKAYANEARSEGMADAILRMIKKIHTE